MGSVNRLLIRSAMRLPSLWDPLNLPTSLVVQNPFGADMMLKTTHCGIQPCQTMSRDRKTCEKYFDSDVGFYTPDQVNEVVPAHSTKTLKEHQAKLNSLLSPAALTTFFASSSGGSLIRLAGTMTM